MSQSGTGATYEPQARCIAVFVRRIGGQLKVAAVTPSVLVAYRGDEVIWDVVCDEDGIDVQITNFQSKRVGGPPPWVGDDERRRAKTHAAGGVSIGDTVRSDAARDEFEYSVLLNGSEAVDPEVRIRETP